MAVDPTGMPPADETLPPRPDTDEPEQPRPPPQQPPRVAMGGKEFFNSSEPGKPNFIDKLQSEGYSADEIATWIDKQRPTMKAAGYSDQQINKTIGELTSPQGPVTKPQRAAPQSPYQSEGDAMMQVLMETATQNNPRMQNAALAQISKIYEARRLQQADSQATYKMWADDNIAEAMNTGNVTRPIPPGDFVAQFGQQAYHEYQANVQLGLDRHILAGMAPEDQGNMLAGYEPQPGTAGYAAAIARRNSLGKALEEIQKQKMQAPADFALANLPTVQHAWQAFLQVMMTQNDPGVRKQYAALFAEKMIAEQQRVGIPESETQILPKAYVDEFAKRLARVPAEGTASTVVQDIDSESQLWGKYWPKVYQGIAKQAGPLVRVLGSGDIPPRASTKLAEANAIPVNQLLRDMDEQDTKSFKSAVISAFKPFAATLTGSNRSQVLEDFLSQGEKLAAIYKGQGGLSDYKAAEAAFNDLVGHKYDFSAGTYRVPKKYVDDHGVPHSLDPVDVANGVAVATSMIGTGNLAVAPKRDDTGGGLSSAYLEGNTVQSLKDFGKWVTSPDESGLTLFQGEGFAARGPTGKPITLTWEELSEMGKQHPLIEMTPTGGVTP